MLTVEGYEAKEFLLKVEMLVNPVARDSYM
jgi:hypothetical protein